MVEAKTGLLFDPYFSAGKIAGYWTCRSVRARAERVRLPSHSRLLFAMASDWWTGACSDVTNAARTLLYNIIEQKWDEGLLALFGIPDAILPEVRDNAAVSV